MRILQRVLRACSEESGGGRAAATARRGRALSLRLWRMTLVCVSNIETSVTTSRKRKVNLSGMHAAAMMQLHFANRRQLETRTLARATRGQKPSHVAGELHLLMRGAMPHNAYHLSRAAHAVL